MDVLDQQREKERSSKSVVVMIQMIPEPFFVINGSW
jgi:hypothetical protein